MSVIALNGTSFYPTDAPKELTKVGTSLVMANGTRRFVYRAHKRSWELSWSSVPNATRAAIETIALLVSTFIYDDQHGSSWTVQCEDGCYSDSVAIIAGDGTLYYDVKLVIHEA